MGQPNGLTVNVNSACRTEDIDESAEEGIYLYPNPTDGKSSLVISSENSESVEITLTDLLGNTVSYQIVKLETGLNNNELDLSNLPAGVYTLSIRSSESLKSRLLIRK